MRPIHYFLLMTATLLGCASVANAQSRRAVVELFTSEGCSSCPPAEAYVGELAQRSDVLALSYHVDYWDDLGWHDRFGLPAAVQRQQTYAKALRLATVYTPQVVIDGKQDFVGSDRRSIGSALGAQRNGVPVTITVADGEVLVNLGAQAQTPASDVVLVAYQRTAISPIGRGENAGRTITEFNIVREFHSLGRWDGHARQYRAPVGSLPGDATDVAVLVQAVGQAPIIGAQTVALR